MTKQHVIKAVDLTKSYPGRRRDYLSILRGRRPAIDETAIHSLQGVSFSVEKGEIVGVVGHNGAGKSTLLRLIAGIAQPTSGSIEVNGRIATLLDLSAGLRMLKSGRDNIVERLELLGVPKAKFKSLVEEIVTFAELDNCIDNIIASYSTGMRMRLAFAIATTVSCDILLIDEALAVGDEFFSAKSFARIEALTRRGLTCLIVSHDWTKIFRLASRVLWLEHGKLRMDDVPSKVLYPYLESLNSFRITHEIELASVSIKDRNGRNKRIFDPDEDVFVDIKYKLHSDIKEFAVITGVMSALTGESVLSAYSLDDGITVKCFGKEGRFVFRYPAPKLHPGPYDLTLLLATPEQGPYPVEYLQVWGPITGNDCRIEIRGQTFGRPAPLVRLDANWEIHNL